MYFKGGEIYFAWPHARQRLFPLGIEQQGITKEVRKDTSVISMVARQLLLIREHREQELLSPYPREDSAL